MMINSRVPALGRKVDSVKQPVQLLQAELDDGAVFSWLDKARIFQALLQ
jgi:hypothetical protein